MGENKYSWNQTLKFSWGHIIAFVALIFISYVMYMGIFYKNGGDFSSAAIKVAFIDFALLSTFIGAQIIKGTDERFERSIIIERVLIILCPIVFCYAMFSYNHFWSVFEQRNLIENQFNSSIERTKQMFVSYDAYAEQRINNYKNGLDSILVLRANGDVSLYKKAGFTGVNDRYKKDNFLHTLELQLRSQNVDSLELIANKWIDEANQGANVWNAFLVGNIQQIASAIQNWHTMLQSYSNTRLSNEEIFGNEVLPFDENAELIETVIDDINSLKSIYVKTNGLKFHTIWTGLLIFAMLLFPYFLQKRSTRAEGLYFLIPGSKAKSYDEGLRSSNIRNGKINFDQVNGDNLSTSEGDDKSFSDDVFRGTF